MNNELIRILTEDRKNELIQKSKRSDNYKDKSNGKNRFERRLKSKIAPSTRHYNSIDMNKLFTEGELDVDIEVTGETSKYLVKIRMENFINQLQEDVKNADYTFDRRIVTRALIALLNSEDIYVSCTCPDFKYRIAYYDTKDKISSGPPELRASNITNPNNTKGPGCKHIMLVLNNNSWLMKVSSVIYNYTTYMKDHKENLYGKIIYPAIYGKAYDKDTQIEMGDEDNRLATDKDTIDKSNQYAKDRTKFKSGNEFRFQKGPDGDANQIELDLSDEINK